MVTMEQTILVPERTAKYPTFPAKKGVFYQVISKAHSYIKTTFKQINHSPVPITVPMTGDISGREYTKCGKLRPINDGTYSLDEIGIKRVIKKAS